MQEIFKNGKLRILDVLNNCTLITGMIVRKTGKAKKWAKKNQ